MGVDERHLSQCAGKDRLTPEQARQIVRKMRRKRACVTSYRCDICGAWHVGRARSDAKVTR